MRPPQIFVIVLDREHEDRYDEAAQAARAFEREAVPVRWLRAVATKSSVGSESNRPLHILSARDAHSLYLALHDGPVGVLANTKARVRHDVHGPLSSRKVMPVERFVRHKAAYRTVGAEDAVSQLFDELHLWPGERACLDDRDPRILPMHVFSATEWGELHGDERTRFEREHGKPTALVDHAQRQWKRTTALHGSQQLHVRGTSLPAGFHWDVQSPGSAEHLGTHTVAWAFKRGSYANIYPDATIRAGQRSALSARPIWNELDAEKEKRSRIDRKNSPKRSGKRGAS